MKHEIMFPGPRVVSFFVVVRNSKISKINDVLSESFMHLLLRPIFRQSHPNFINVRTAYASKIWAQLTKNLLAKSSTKRFREYINEKKEK